MKIIKNKAASTLIITMICPLLFALGFASYAWFTTWFSSGDIGFGAGTLGDNVLEIAKVVRTDATAYADEESRAYFPCDDFTIEHDSLPVLNGDSYTIALQQMTFGIIDNVAMLSPDNVVYLRLTVPKTNGSNLRMKLFYNVGDDGRFFEIYKNIYADDNETVIGQQKITEDDVLDDGVSGVLDGFAQAETIGDDCFLRFSVLLSGTEYAATELHSLDFYGSDGLVANENSDNYYRVNDFNESSDGISFSSDTLDSVADNYYLYVRIEPNLEVFSHSIEYISPIMPCFVYYKIFAEFEIY